MTVRSKKHGRQLFCTGLTSLLSLITILVAGPIGTLASFSANGEGGAGVGYVSVQFQPDAWLDAGDIGQDRDPVLKVLSNPHTIESLSEVLYSDRYEGLVPLFAAGGESVSTLALPAGDSGGTDGLAAEKADQTISVTAAAPATAGYASAFDVAATASSGLAVAITTSGVCSGSGSDSATITMTGGTGNCTVYFNQAGDADYAAAPETTTETTAAKADQIVSVAAAYASTFDVAATASSGLAVAITTSGVCSGSGSDSATITMTSGTGPCTVHYKQTGDDNYTTSETTNDITAIKANQRITVTSAAPASAAYASTFEVTATASSNLAVAITTSGVCSGSGEGLATMAMTSATGTCTLHFNQSGDSNFFAATEVTETVSAEKANLIVTPNPPTASRQYGDGNPSFEPAYSGLAAGDGVSDLSEEPTCSTTAGLASAPGSYPIMCTGGSAENYTFSYDEGATLTVTAEDASIEFSRQNLAAVKATSSGKYSKRFSLKVLVKEKQPDIASYGTAAGDINSADLTVTLAQLLAGDTIKLACKGDRVSVTGYEAVKTFTCHTDEDLGVDVYEVTAQTTGHYTGVVYDSMTVYDQARRFSNGGGWFHWPDTQERTSFGFMIKNDKSHAALQGNLLVIRHHTDGTVSRIKSDLLTGLLLRHDAKTGCGYVTFSGNATYTAWNPSANSGHGEYVSTGENPFMTYAEDCNNPGNGPDYFLVRSGGAIQMPADVYPNKVPIPVDQGNIFVPNRVGKKK